MIISLLQFLTAIVLVGWIWAIYWSYLIFLEAQGKGQQMSVNQNYAGVDPGMGGPGMNMGGPGMGGPAMGGTTMGGMNGGMNGYMAGPGG